MMGGGGGNKTKGRYDQNKSVNCWPAFHQRPNFSSRKLEMFLNYIDGKYVNFSKKFKATEFQHMWT